MTAGRRGRTRGGPAVAVELDRYRAIVPDWGPFAAAASRPEPTVLRVRAGGVPEPELLARLGRQGFRLRALHGLPGFHQVDDGPFPISFTFEHWLGLFYVQQASTGLAAPALAAAPGERVLDLCAAPGGKTTHLAELMRGRGCLVASEISESRIRGLLGNVYRLGHAGVLAVAGDGRDFPEGALFDRVLVDAPCSGEGTLRRRGGKLPRQSRGFAGYAHGAQRALLERAVRLTRPGGTVLYVTCTFAPEENEAVVSDVLARTPVEVDPIELDVPHARGVTSFEDARYDERMEGAVRIYPHHLDSGGLFMARLRRVDGVARDDTGWTRVPPAFPGEGVTWPDAERTIERARAELEERWGRGAPESGDAGWIVRGGRLWMHTVDEWPIESWAEGGWRVVSLGLRSIELDTRGRARPTNDFLRWAGPAVRERAVDVGRGELDRMLRREAVPTSEDRRGPVAIRFRGEVIGRGALTERGLVSEIPKARAADLVKVLERLDGV